MTNRFQQAVTRFEPPGPVICWTMRILALAGLGISGFLLYIGLSKGQQVPGCAPDSGCSDVLNSHWSMALGLPTAFPAVVVYLCVLWAVMHIGPGASHRCQRLAWQMLVVLGAIILGAAAWFLFLQFLVLGSFCKYCLAAHGCGILLALVAFMLAPIGPKRMLPGGVDDPLALPVGTASVLVLVGFLAVGAMATVQYTIRPKRSRIVNVDSGGKAVIRPKRSRTVNVDSDEGAVVSRPPEGHWVELLDGKIGFDPFDVPTIGKPGAEATIVLLFDYACPHCRRVHKVLHNVRSSEPYRHRVALVVLPLPINPDCNPFFRTLRPQFADSCERSRIALAVWRSKRDVFAEFDHWMFQTKKHRTARQARARAERLVGAEKFKQAMKDPWVDQMLKLALALHELSLGEKKVHNRVPKLIMSNTYFVGEPDMEEITTAFDEELNRLGSP